MANSLSNGASQAPRAPMSILSRDALFALRSLSRRPTFPAIAVGTLALGIGASTSIYSVVDGILFRPLPFKDASRLIAVWETYPFWKKEPILANSWDRITFSVPEYRDWRGARRPLTARATHRA